MLPTQNEAWGFYGTIKNHHDPAQAWTVAFERVQAVTGASDDAVRAFLDSRDGRHFADDVAGRIQCLGGLGPAVAASVAVWMAWTISHREHREHGIPWGLPYLTAWVEHHGITAEAEAAEKATQQSNDIAQQLTGSKARKERTQRHSKRKGRN